MAIPGASGNKPLSALYYVNEAEFIRLVTMALKQHDGDIERTALYLKIGRNTLYLWLKRSPPLRAALEKMSRPWQAEQAKTRRRSVKA